MRPCYDGRRHRWEERPHYPWPNPEKWCRRCGLWWLDRHLSEAERPALATVPYEYGAAVLRQPITATAKEAGGG